ncbi:MAG TPA: EAL domain-containing protein [Steroidobacteraceae bacterium]|nr:EAL domain-containing protein [Steroidobacteraceae bacterium]
MWSFRNRLLVLLIGLVVGAQTVTLFTALARTKATERARADQQLVDGARNALRQLENRERLLTNSVAVLTRDWALRAAVAEGDGQTVSSALANHGARIGASLTMALDLDGRVIARGDAALLDTELEAVVTGAIDGAASDHAQFVTTSRGAHQIFVSPLLDEIGYVALGFSVDTALARELSDQLGVEVAFLVHGQPSQSAIASTIPTLRGEVLTGNAEAHARPAEIAIDGEGYLATLTALPGVPSQLDLVLLKPMRAVMAPYRRLAMDLGWIIGLTLAAAVIAGLYLGRSAARPVQRLAAGAARVAAGDYSQQVEGSGGQELAHLAGAFNSMQQGIADRESRLLHLARHDSSTGLPNRLFAEQWLDEQLQQLPREKLLGVVLVTVTNLAEISASLGHGMVDQLTRHLARCLADWQGEGSFVARIDAANFLVASRRISTDGIGILLQEVRARARTPLDTAGITLQAAITAGAAVGPTDGTTANELLRCAEAAVETAMQRGQPQAFFEPANDEAQRRRLQLGADLPQAMESSQLHLRFQPKYRMRDRRPVGVEALVRWQHPEFGEVSPVEFIPIAERTGASGLLTRWVLKEALAQLAAWQQQGIGVGVAVNLSAPDILDPDLLRFILGGLRDARIAPGLLTLEITESVLLHEPDSARRNIEMLRIAGVRFSIDDFGTGYSSLSQLRALAADELKIDKSFVRDLAQGAEDGAMIRAIVDLGHGLGLRTVAEGVETEEQWRILADLGCDVAQGYLTGAPQLAAALTPALAQALANAEGDSAIRTVSRRVLELRRSE